MHCYLHKQNIWKLCFSVTLDTSVSLKTLQLTALQPLVQTNISHCLSISSRLYQLFTFFRQKKSDEISNKLSPDSCYLIFQVHWKNHKKLQLLQQSCQSMNFAMMRQPHNLKRLEKYRIRLAPQQCRATFWNRHQCIQPLQLRVWSHQSV